MPDSAFNLKGTLLCDVKIDGQPLVGEVQDGNFSNMEALVAGVPIPFRSAFSGISALPAFSMAARILSSV